MKRHSDSDYGAADSPAKHQGVPTKPRQYKLIDVDWTFVILELTFLEIENPAAKDFLERLAIDIAWSPSAGGPARSASHFALI